MTVFRSVVLEHFRHPRNRRLLESPDVSVEGANPLCGDRIRLELRIASGAITAAGFTADACALCVAAASLLTERLGGMRLDEVGRLPDAMMGDLLGGDVPAAREKCALLPLTTLRRALERLHS
jgi:nitrogen fixation protein NifU and related proteins